MTKYIRVLGVDPGTLITGYGIVETENGKLTHICNGSIRSNRGEPMKDRLKKIFDSLREVIEMYKPEIAAIESGFVATSVSSALKLGHARGVAILSAACMDLSVFEYSPTEVKLAATGYGRADKNQIQRMVQRLLDLPESPKPDPSDALAVAICHIHSMKIGTLTHASR
jgi:crossover junction endodeoxyribonuclease RuvC